MILLVDKWRTTDKHQLEQSKAKQNNNMVSYTTIYTKLNKDSIGKCISDLLFKKLNPDPGKLPKKLQKKSTETNPP